MPIPVTGKPIQVLNVGDNFSHYCCCPDSAISGSWNQKGNWDSNLGTRILRTDSPSSILVHAPNACPDSIAIVNYIHFVLC